ncbi:MAG: hypothetical protein GY845_22435 [Planctomycetes bacterium]|nr:hypothetical protein [Planctomycetota bacterium]
MQNTMVREKKPLIALDDSAIKVKATQGITFTEKESLITLDDLATHKGIRLVRKLLIMLIVVNLIVLVSIVLCT